MLTAKELAKHLIDYVRSVGWDHDRFNQWAEREGYVLSKWVHKQILSRHAEAIAALAAEPTECDQLRELQTELGKLKSENERLQREISALREERDQLREQTERHYEECVAGRSERESLCDAIGIPRDSVRSVALARIKEVAEENERLREEAGLLEECRKLVNELYRGCNIYVGQASGIGVSKCEISNTVQEAGKDIPELHAKLHAKRVATKSALETPVAKAMAAVVSIRHDITAVGLEERLRTIEAALKGVTG